MRNAGDGAIAHSNDPTMKVTPPMRNIRRRPVRSPRRPDTTTNAASAIVYAVSTNDSVAAGALGKSASILGRITGTVPESIDPRKTAAVVTEKTCQCFGSVGAPGLPTSQP
jgi:hypothetical protein